MNVKLTCLVCALLLPTSMAFAQDSSETVYESETNYDFDAEQIDGSVLRPDADLIGGQRSRRQSSLIRIRMDFVPEMIKSVESL
jgi:hypothetical protein